MTHPCALHAKMGKTCCQTSQVLVTDGDKVRIADHVVHDRALLSEHWFDFWHAAPAEPEYLADDHDKVWMLHVNPDGTRDVLRRREDGSCTFLGVVGCTLPHDVRPLVCRIFPWDFDLNGVEGCALGCPAEVIPPGKQATDMFALTREEAEILRETLYIEIERKHVISRNDEPPWEFLDPGIADFVRALWDRGFKTTDSGDGRHKATLGYDAECWTPIPHVAIAADASNLAAIMTRLHVWIDSWDRDVNDIEIQAFIYSDMGRIEFIVWVGGESLYGWKP